MSCYMPYRFFARKQKRGVRQTPLLLQRFPKTWDDEMTTILDIPPFFGGLKSKV